MVSIRTHSCFWRSNSRRHCQSRSRWCIAGLSRSHCHRRLCLRFTGTCYRAHDPRWAYAPLSGAGAALRGARFNAKGIPALYLGVTLETAILEANQGFAHKIDPCTLCSYDVDCDDIADLRDEASRKYLGVALGDMACAWSSDLAGGLTPPSWTLANLMIAKGLAGILVPSFANRAMPNHQNLVLWKWGKNLPHQVNVVDTQGRLPRDQSSWQ